MPEAPITVDRRTLITQAWSTERPWVCLLLDRPLLLEAGQKYWLDLQCMSVIVEDRQGRRSSFTGHEGDPAERPR